MVEDLIQATLRLRPDRIILGELRGAEAFSFLRAVSSGHPGSMTTVHADDPRGAVKQLALMALQARANLQRQDVIDHVERVVAQGAWPISGHGVRGTRGRLYRRALDPQHRGRGIYRRHRPMVRRQRDGHALCLPQLVDLERRRPRSGAVVRVGSSKRRIFGLA